MRGHCLLRIACLHERLVCLVCCVVVLAAATLRCTGLLFAGSCCLLWVGFLLLGPLPLHVQAHVACAASSCKIAAIGNMGGYGRLCRLLCFGKVEALLFREGCHGYGGQSPSIKCWRLS